MNGLNNQWEMKGRCLGPRGHSSVLFTLSMAIYIGKVIEATLIVNRFGLNQKKGNKPISRLFIFVIIWGGVGW